MLRFAFRVCLQQIVINIATRAASPISSGLLPRCQYQQTEHSYSMRTLYTLSNKMLQYNGKMD